MRFRPFLLPPKYILMQFTKKFLIETGLIILLGAIAQGFLAWWSIVVVAAGVGLFFTYKYSVVSFLAGFLAVAFLWGIAILILLITREPGLLSAQIGQLFKGLGTAGMIWVTILLGSLMGGLGAMTGTLGRKMFG